MWNLPPPPGFQGLHPDKPLHIYQRNMPHWRQEGATYFATFRLGDSLPQAKLHELQRIREEFDHRHPPPQTDEEIEKLTREIGVRVENWLDQGYGACYFKQPELADHLVKSLHHFDSSIDNGPIAGHGYAIKSSSEQMPPRYELDCYVVMANHAHVIVRPLAGDVYPLEDIIGSWKQYSAKQINRSLERTGGLWLEEAFDRLIRDEEHLWRAIQYIGNNPWNAGVPRESCPLWIRPDWEALGWKFEPERL